MPIARARSGVLPGSVAYHDASLGRLGSRYRPAGGAVRRRSNCFLSDHAVPPWNHWQGLLPAWLAVCTCFRYDCWSLACL